MRTGLRIFTAAITAGALFFTSNVQAQANSSPFWSTEGNNNVDNASKLGTTNAIPLRLFTNDQVRAYISTGGNFGIGTSSPSQRFHVEGTLNQAIFVSTTTPGATSGSGMIGSVKALPTGANNRLGYFLAGSRGGAQNGYNAAGMVGYSAGAWTAGSSHPAYLTFETTPSGSDTRVERLRIEAGGNVGIGTTNPGFLLDVADRIRLRSGSSGTAGLWLNNANNSGQTGFMGVLNSNHMGFYGSTSGWSLLMNTTTGNVGIGNAAPTKKLHVTTTTASGTTAAIIQNLSGGGFNDGLDIQAGSNTGSGSWFIVFKRPDGTSIGRISQASATSVSYNTTSDKRLKTNIRETRFGLSDLKKIEVRDYNFSGSKEEQTGFLAQQLYEIYPEAVSVGGDDPKARPWMIDYGRLTPVLVKAVQDLSQEKDELLSRIEKLEAIVSKLAPSQSGSLSLSSASIGLISPNPVKGSASIRYSIPDGSSGQLLVSDALGRQVKAISLKGAGTLNLDATSLASGVYQYSLLANGKKVQTEKMTVQR